MSVVGELDKCDTLVIAVHGLTSAGETFAEVAAKLVESCPGLACLLIDLPGHGTHRFPVVSDATVSLGAFSCERLAEAILDDVESCGAGELVRRGAKVHLLAHSMGSRPALCLAAMPSFQQRLPLTSLILEDPVHFNSTPVDLNNVRQRALHQEAVFNTMVFGSIDEGVTGLLAAGLNMHPDSLPRKMEEFEPGKFRLRYSLAVSILWKGAAMDEKDAGAWLEGLAVPVLMVMADDANSTISSDEWSDLVPASFRRQRPRCRDVRIPGASHTVHRSHLTQFLQLLLDWIKEHGGY